jgi:hypothetical protein
MQNRAPRHGIEDKKPAAKVAEDAALRYSSMFQEKPCPREMNVLSAATNLRMPIERLQLPKADH